MAHQQRADGAQQALPHASEAAVGLQSPRGLLRQHRHVLGRQLWADLQAKRGSSLE